MTTLLQELCAERPRQFVGPQVGDELPSGWRDLVSDLVADLAGILGSSPDNRVRFVQKWDDTWGLRLGHVLHPPVRGEHPTSVVVAAMIGAATRRSLETCDVCGEAGVPRCGPEGTRSVRCARHAEGTPAVPGGCDAVAALPQALRDAFGQVGGIVGVACRAFPGSLVDLTLRDEVPPGWRDSCRDLLCDVAALMRGTPGTRLELRRVHAIGQDLHEKQRHCYTQLLRLSPADGTCGRNLPPRVGHVAYPVIVLRRPSPAWKDDDVGRHIIGR